MMSTLTPGFAEPVGGAQACFRLVLDAMARPGRVHTVGGVAGPAPLCDAAAAVVLTLMDHETPLWLDPEAEAARAWIAFHTGAPLTDDPARAMVALAFSACDAEPRAASRAIHRPLPVMVGEGPPSTPCDAAPPEGVDGGPAPAMTVKDHASFLEIAALRIGTDEAPETSATVILQVASLTTGQKFVLEGPGLRGPETLTVDGLPADFAAIWQRNHALYPRGIDLILCAGNRIAALPRSVAVREG